MGWRTNGRNLNLNRDPTKLETEEVCAVVAAFNRWRPDLFLDLHVTDGADYQYDITWSMPSPCGWSPAIAAWSARRLEPGLTRELQAMGHQPHRYIWANNGGALSGGAVVSPGSPRFSTTYGDARHLASVLVESHSLKPCRQRVLGTYVVLRSSLALAIAHGAELRNSVAQDEESRPSPVVLDWEHGDVPETKTLPFKAIESEWLDLSASGGKVVRWSAEPAIQAVEFVFKSQLPGSVDRLAAYFVPAAWGDSAEKLRLHGIEVETLDSGETIDAQIYRLPEMRAAGGAGKIFDQTQAIYEGRLRIDPGPLEVREAVLTIPAGSHRVSTDQSLGTLAVLLPEPDAPDWFLQWGYFLETMTQPEYVEAYIMAPMAEAMQADDPGLASAFRQRLESDPEFASSPKARLRCVESG